MEIRDFDASLFVGSCLYVFKNSNALAWSWSYTKSLELDYEASQLVSASELVRYRQKINYRKT